MFYRRTNTSEIQRRFGTGPDLPPPTPTWIISRRSQWSAGHCRGQQRGTEKQTSPTSPQNWTRRRHLRGSGSRRRRSPPHSPPRFSMCLHFVEMCTAHVKAHETVSKRGEKKHNHVTEEPKTTPGRSQSHSPFFTFNFLSWWRPDLRPDPRTSLSRSQDCQLSWKLLRSVFSLLLLLRCIVGSAVRYSKRTVGPKKKKIARPSAKPTNFCCILSLCERSLGTFACCPAQKTSKGHLDIVLFLFVRVCVCGGCVCVYLTTFIRCGNRKHRPTTNSFGGRRGDLSSPVVLCNESETREENGK